MRRFKQVLDALRKFRKRKFVKVLEKQLKRIEATKTGSAEVRAIQARKKRDAIVRAREQLAAMCLALMALSSMGCAHALAGTLESATVIASEALMLCESTTSATPGDTSQGAQDARRECLRLPDFAQSQDAAVALGDELDAIRIWILTGSSATLH